MAGRGLHRWTAGLGIGTVVLALAACVTDYQQGVDDPPYGPPSAARRPDQSGGTDAGTGTTQCAPEAGACTVTFRAVLDSFKTAQCSAGSSCHGGATEPRINPDDPAATYAALTTYVIKSNGKPYINPCSTNPSDSSITCNLNPPGTCGVPMPQGGSFDSAKLNDIQTWIQCGSPNN